ncbi:MAG: CubicO group peptidase (beta-lactamase class C family) [Gammaproteobacteria bacterium]|jgi:CubicO group peptidase (beta-lactamase class C family)
MTVRLQLTHDCLQQAKLDQQVDNGAFLPDETAVEAKHSLAIALDVAAFPMRSNHSDITINGKAVDLFPAVSLRLTSHDGDLIPLERDLLRDPDGNSYWDISLSPGRVWSEATDDGWSRAALPFQLSNIFENDTHHGIATFLFNERDISPVFFQIVAETKAFLCPENLQAWGWMALATSAIDAVAAAETVAAYQIEKADMRPFKPLGDWKSDTTAGCFELIDNGFGSDSTLISGLVVDDEIYASPCKTSQGDYPYPEALKFGIWSATKTAFCSVACARIAQISGADPRNNRVRDLLPDARQNPGWDEVTIGDCMNMASGIGTAATEAEPRSIFADYLLIESQVEASGVTRDSYDHYHSWFLAPSQREKNLAAFACPSYPWPPGSVTRYRDQDLYIAGAALDAVLKQIRGPAARIWDMVRDEVYAPARIHHAIKFQTIETDPAQQVPLSDAGLLLTMDNIAGLGKLILDDGRVGDEQILEQILLDEFFNPRKAKGLPTGIHIEDGEVHYHAGIWHLPYRSLVGELLWIPSMRGYGGQIIQTLPNGVTAFRFGFDSYETEERYDALKLVKLADAIRPF